MGAAFSRLKRKKSAVHEPPPPYVEVGGISTAPTVEKPRDVKKSPSAVGTVSDPSVVESQLPARPLPQVPTPAWPLPPGPASAWPLQPVPASTCLAKDTVVKEPWQCVPLIDIAHAGYREVAEVLVNAGADIEARNARGQTALYAAARGGHLSVVRFLHEKGASLDVRTYKAGTPIYSAARFGHLEVVEYLLAHGVSPNQAKEEVADRSPLAVAVRKRHTRIVKALLAAGALTRAANGKTPLYLASRSNFPELVKLLLEHGADPNETTWDVSRCRKAGETTATECGPEKESDTISPDSMAW